MDEEFIHNFTFDEFKTSFPILLHLVTVSVGALMFLHSLPSQNKYGESLIAKISVILK